MTSILALYKNTRNVTLNSVIGKDKYIYILQQVRRDFLLRLKYQIQPLHGITVLFKLITMQGHQNTTITKGTISKDTALCLFYPVAKNKYFVFLVVVSKSSNRNSNQFSTKPCGKIWFSLQSYKRTRIRLIDNVAYLWQTKRGQSQEAELYSSRMAVYLGGGGDFDVLRLRRNISRDLKERWSVHRHARQRSEGSRQLTRKQCDRWVTGVAVPPPLRTSRI